MAEQDRSTSFVPILLVFTLIGGVGGGLYLYEPYESSRPKETTVEISATVDPEFVPARVWQDPFNAIRRCQQGQATDENAECAPKNDQPSWPHSLSQSQDKPSELVIMPIMVYGGTYSEDVENRRRRRYAIISAMAMQDYQLNDAENIGFFKFPSNHSSDKE